MSLLVSILLHSQEAWLYHISSEGLSPHLPGFVLVSLRLGGVSLTGLHFASFFFFARGRVLVSNKRRDAQRSIEAFVSHKTYM